MQGMKEISKDEFFATVGQLDVHPRPEKMRSVWELRNRQMVGIRTPGYLCVDEDGKYTTVKRYYVPA